MRKISIVFIVLFCAAKSFAQLDGNPENWCRGGFFPRESEKFSLGKVKAKKGEKVYFYGDDEKDCPDGKSCKQKSYVIAGDEVIVSRNYGKWSCSWFQPKKGGATVGWILTERLEFTEMLQGIESYAGNWSFYDNSIEIFKTRNPKIFNVKGNAFWRGSGNNVHTGEIDGEAEFSGNVLKYGEKEKDEYACKAVFDLVGDYLVVSDNLQCGGVNVTFSGVYRRTKGK